MWSDISKRLEPKTLQSFDKNGKLIVDEIKPLNAHSKLLNRFLELLEKIEINTGAP